MFKLYSSQTAKTSTHNLLNSLQLSLIRGGVESGIKTKAEETDPFIDLTKPVIDPVTGLPVIPQNGKK